MPAPTQKRWSITDILDRTDLAALLDEHTTATGEGHRRRWHCPVPDHDDHHASVTMAADAHGHQRWRCWSGDDTHRGDAIDLIMITQRTDRATAIEHLAQRAGLSLDEPLPPAPPDRSRCTNRSTAMSRHARTCCGHAPDNPSGNGSTGEASTRRPCEPTESEPTQDTG
jgi:hypothetical protein